MKLYAVVDAKGNEAVMYVPDGRDPAAELLALHGTGAKAHPIDMAALESVLQNMAPDAPFVDFIKAHHQAADTTITITS